MSMSSVEPATTLEKSPSCTNPSSVTVPRIFMSATGNCGRLWDDRQIADDRVADVEGRRIALALRRHPQGDVGQVEVPDLHGPVGDVGVVTGCWNAFRCPVLRVFEIALRTVPGLECHGSFPVVPAWDDRQLGAFGPVAFPDPFRDGSCPSAKESLSISQWVRYMPRDAPSSESLPIRGGADFHPRRALANLAVSALFFDCSAAEIRRFLSVEFV